MMNKEMKQTVFHIEKLQNVVNVGGSSAFQIYTYPGDVIGRIGAIADPEQNPSNDECIDTATTAITGFRASSSLVRQALCALRAR